jgi:hypothetical protein
MPGDPHPLAVVYGAGNVDKAAIIADGKVGYRRGVADNDEIRSTDFSGQYGGLYVRATRRRYYLDTESIAADDDENVVIDAAGNHFLFETEGSEPLELEYTDADVDAGVITLDEGVSIAAINVTTAVTVQLLASADHTESEIVIKDIGGTAGAGAITPAFDGSEQCDGQAGSAFQITTPYGFIKFRKKSGGGWYSLGGQL